MSSAKALRHVADPGTGVSIEGVSVLFPVWMKTLRLRQLRLSRIEAEEVPTKGGRINAHAFMALLRCVVLSQGVGPSMWSVRMPMHGSTSRRSMRRWWAWEPGYSILRHYCMSWPTWQITRSASGMPPGQQVLVRPGLGQSR